MAEVTEEEIVKISQKLKPKTSHGHDEISTKTLKLSIPSVLLPLKHIFNKSILTGIVPEQLKIS